MVKMHNRYRKAKWFKLDDDMQVVDEFTGNRVSHLRRDWDFYDYRRHRLLDLMGPAKKRYFRSRVGDNWDTVYSDFCHKAKEWGAYREHWLHDNVGWGTIEQRVVMVDGIPHEHRWGELRKLWEGTVYVHPETKVVSIVPTVKKPPKKRYERTYHGYHWEDKPRHWGCDVVKVGEVEFVRAKLEYQRRVSSGVFKTETAYIWYKQVPYTVKLERRVPVHVRNTTNTGWTVSEYRTEHYEETRWKKTTASKQEIKQHKLNEKV